MITGMHATGPYSMSLPKTRFFYFDRGGVCILGELLHLVRLGDECGRFFAGLSSGTVGPTALIVLEAPQEVPAAC
jgi:hypothetical protein